MMSLNKSRKLQHYRPFGGLTYARWRHVNTIEDARDIAKRQRKLGNKIRIVPRPKGYDLFRRKKDWRD